MSAPTQTHVRRPDIRRPAAVDAAWLTAVLQAGGVDAVVGGFIAKGVGTGQIGDSVRFTLAYARGGEGAPASLVGKFPSAGEESRQTGIALGNYIREVRFYQQLAPSALISTPRVWFTDVDEASSEFVLMMDDLAPAKQGDQLAGVSLDEARLVLVEAAKLHASHWADEGLEELPWLSGTKASPPSAVTNEAVGALWEGFKRRYDGRLRPEWIQQGDRLCADYVRIAERHDGPRSLAHLDFRPDNMMFGTADGGAPVTVLDWQSIAYASGPSDVAYFLAGALSPEARRAAEPELLALYHRTLVEHGVAGYSLQDATRHYGEGGHRLFMTAFFAGMIVTQTARGDEMFLQMLGGGAAHMLDHDPLA